jgi:hypothetical protein
VKVKFLVLGRGACSPWPAAASAARFDVIYGTPGADTLAGDDRRRRDLRPRRQRPSSAARTGNDVLYGGAGNDVMWPGSGVDVQYGGAGTTCCMRWRTTTSRHPRLRARRRHRDRDRARPGPLPRLRADRPAQPAEAAALAASSGDAS